MSEIQTPNTSVSPSYRRQRAFVEQQKRVHVDKTPEFETVEMGVVQRNDKGEARLENGFPVVKIQTILRRDVVAAQWDDRIKRFEDTWIRANRVIYSRRESNV